METSVDDAELLPIITAAMRRVHIYNHLNETEFGMEALWHLKDVVLTDKGRIIWRVFPLGKELFLSLSEAQNWRCCYCGVHMQLDAGMDNDTYPTIEHVRTIFHGGSDHPKNLVVACRWCNSRRSNLPINLYLRQVQPYHAQ